MSTTSAASAASSPAPVPAKSVVKPIPEGMRTVTPHLTCAGAVKALEFYAAAFGAVELMRVAEPQGRIMHASIKIGDSMVMLNDEFPEMCGLGPKAIGGTPVTIHLSVEDAEAWFDRAVKAGATVKMPLADMFWGARYGLLEDPFGHNWSIATQVREVGPEELAAAVQGACAG